MDSSFTMLETVQEILHPKSTVDVTALCVLLTATLAYLLHGTVWNKKDPFLHLYFERPQTQNGAGSAAARQNRNIASQMRDLQKTVVVFWGSQSGVAEGFANRLSRELHLRFGVGVMSADLSDYDSETISEIPEQNLAIFIMSTYGEGDPSDNAHGFWEWLSNKKSSQQLEQLRYAAFGLGNRNYKHYNRVIDVVNTSLEGLGAKAILPLGKADDSQGATGEDFMAWKEDLFVALRTSLGFEEQPLVYEPTIEIIEDDSVDLSSVRHDEPAHSPTPSALPIVQSRELFQASDRNCLHMELDISGAQEIRYKTGDHVAIWPVNPEAEVTRLIRCLGLEKTQDTPVLIRSLEASSPSKIPSPTTVSTLFRNHLEICAAPSRDMIRTLAPFAPNEAARTFLLDLAANKEALAKFVARNHLTLGRLLGFAAGEASVWTALPLSLVVESLQPLQPRYYSISSSSVLSPRRIAVTALVSKTPLHDAPDQSIHGVTTNYMRALTQPADALTSSDGTPEYRLQHTSTEIDVSAPRTLYAHVRKSRFKLPMTSSCPVIMIGAGTGLAPFRAFIAERAKLHAIGRPVGKMLLFFGCRNPEQDYIYREELEQAQKRLGQDVLTIVTAFSRVPGQSSEKPKYVQDGIEKSAAEVCSMLVDQGANLYICGRASMARDVGRRVESILAETRGLAASEAEAFLGTMRRSHRWQEDVWG